MRAPRLTSDKPDDVAPALPPAAAEPATDPEEPMVMDGPFIETKELAL
jgi:hypothetical protein